MPLWNKIGAFIPSEGKKHRLPRDVVDELEDAIRAASLANANLDRGPDATQVVVRTGERETVFEGTVTDFIRDRVRLHHGSWVIAPLQRILAWSLSKDDGSMGEYRLTDRLDSDWPNPETVDEMREELTRLTEVEIEFKHVRNAVETAIANLKDKIS